jgi:hypothetical protein
MNETTFEDEEGIERGFDVDVEMKGLCQFEGGISEFGGRCERIRGSTWLLRTWNKSIKGIAPSIRRQSCARSAMKHASGKSVHCEARNT